MSTTLDMSAILMQVYELADMFDHSQEVNEYFKCKEALKNDHTAQQWMAHFQKKKEEFAEVDRFGWYHPDYREKYQELVDIKSHLDELETVRHFQQAEDRLEKLLYHVSRTIARSVSHTIKVPRDETLSGGCGSGGCGGNCGGAGGCGN